MIDNFSLYEPSFGSTLATQVLELEHLRRKVVQPTTHAIVFQQLKRLFHTLESVGSARIEGNNTTLAEYLERQEPDTPQALKNEDFLEIQNIEYALHYIEACGTERPIDRIFLSELHQIVVQNLTTEGDKDAGNYRQHSVKISGSAHTPPDALLVPEMMHELLEFIANKDKPQFDLIKIAQAHHRFVWIHPFGNGNGRTVRLFTYAMLIRAGFRVDIAGRIVNPTAIFCSNRDAYYRHLAEADTGTPEGIEAWCAYVLGGLLDEIKKIDQLGNYDFLRTKVLLPAIEDAYTSGKLDSEEAEVLRIVAQKQLVKRADITIALKGKSQASQSRKIQDMLTAQLLSTEKPNGRKYVLSITGRRLIPSITKLLSAQGFLPSNL